MQEEEKANKVLDIVIEGLIERKKDTFIVVLGVLLGIFFQWNIVQIFIFAVFLWSLLGPIPSRHLALPATFFLIFVPILLALDRKEQAEEFAIYVYYFLLMIVVRGFQEMWMNHKKEQKEAKTT